MSSPYRLNSGREDLLNRRIIESGTHEQLMSKPNGFYAKLYGMQGQKLEILESDFASEQIQESV
jgi:hypothetical protein